jgi:hypothetical protein
MEISMVPLDCQIFTFREETLPMLMVPLGCVTFSLLNEIQPTPLNHGEDPLDIMELGDLYKVFHVNDTPANQFFDTSSLMGSDDGSVVVGSDVGTVHDVSDQDAGAVYDEAGSVGDDPSYLVGSDVGTVHSEDSGIVHDDDAGTVHDEDAGIAHDDDGGTVDNDDAVTVGNDDGAVDDSDSHHDEFGDDGTVDGNSDYDHEEFDPSFFHGGYKSNLFTDEEVTTYHERINIFRQEFYEEHGDLFLFQLESPPPG